MGLKDSLYTLVWSLERVLANRATAEAERFADAVLVMHETFPTEEVDSFLGPDQFIKVTSMDKSGKELSPNILFAYWISLGSHIATNYLKQDDFRYALITWTLQATQYYFLSEFLDEIQDDDKDQKEEEDPLTQFLTPVSQLKN